MFIGSKFYSPWNDIYPPWKPAAATVYLQSVPSSVWVHFISGNTCTNLIISEQSWLRHHTVTVHCKSTRTSYGIWKLPHAKSCPKRNLLFHTCKLHEWEKKQSWPQLLGAWL